MLCIAKTEHCSDPKTKLQPTPPPRSEDEETVGYVAQLKPQGKRLSAFDAGGTAACKAGQDEDGKEKKDGEDDSKFEYREVCPSVLIPLNLAHNN